MSTCRVPQTSIARPNATVYQELIVDEVDDYPAEGPPFSVLYSGDCFRGEMNEEGFLYSEEDNVIPSYTPMGQMSLPLHSLHSLIFHSTIPQHSSVVHSRTREDKVFCERDVSIEEDGMLSLIPFSLLLSLPWDQSVSAIISVEHTEMIIPRQMPFWRKSVDKKKV